LIVDGHLDLADNVLVAGRDYTLTAARIREIERRRAEQATVSLPDMVRGDVGLAFATLFAEPDGAGYSDQGYRTPAEAERQALDQLELYRRWDVEGRVRIIRSVTELDRHLVAWTEDRTIGLVILMEGADPIVSVRDLDAWWNRGVRIVGPAWSRTRYAGGTGAPGGLTREGRDLVAAMRDRGMILDASHLSDEAFWDVAETGSHALIASHSNARSLVPGDRQLTDEMIRAIGQQGGIVGLVLYNALLDPAWSEDRETVVTMDRQVRAHAEHVAGLVGWDAIGIGSDLDGGLGLEETPRELDTVADLGKIGDVVPPEARAGVLGENWIRLLRRALPGPAD
jgi:membrane dipeptidase